MGKNPRNVEYIREYNRKLFLSFLRSGEMSRSELARRMGVTRAATANIADELLQEGYISQTDGAPVGRSAAPLKLRADCRYAIGVYLNRDGCTVGIVDICGGLHGVKELHLDGNTIEEKIDPLVFVIQELIQNVKIPLEKIVGIGVSAPGPLDGENGTILNPPRFDLWHNVSIGMLLQQRLFVPVYVENNATSLARFHQGKPEANGSEDFLLLLVDSGVGSGVISGGKVLKGAGYFTGELGHICIDRNGKPCDCGNTGCLEVYAAIPNLLQGSGFTDWKSVIDSLPDERANRLLQQEAEYLSIGIVSLTNLVCVDTVLLAGDILYGVEKLAPILEEKVNHRSMRRGSIPIRVYPSYSGADVRVQAAADIAFGRFLLK